MTVTKEKSILKLYKSIPYKYVKDINAISLTSKACFVVRKLLVLKVTKRKAF